jgi:hypothetical protein
MNIEDKVTPGEGGQPVSQCLKRQIDRILAWAAQFAASPFWVLKAVLLSIAFSVLCASGIDIARLKEGYPPSYYQKVEHPLLDMTHLYEPGSHEEKLNYRLTVPVLLHPLKLPENLVLRVVLPAITIFGVCCVILFSCLVAYRITGDRVTSLFIALNAGSNYAGSFACIGFYDSIALAQVTLAMLPGIHPAALGFLVFSASFTDERAFAACGLLLAREFCVSANIAKLSQVLNKRVLAIVFGMASYWLVRLLLIYGYGLNSTRKGIGPGTFVSHIQFWHPGTWFALKGGWFLFFLAVVALWQHRQWIKISIFMLVTAVVVGFGFMVGDLLRSTSYVYPVVFIALAIICKNEGKEMVRRYCLLAFIISAVAGSYNIFLGEITWFMPLPVMVINKLAHILYGIFRLKVFHGMP